MKKIIISVIILGFVFSANNVLAVFPDDLPGPHIMPDSPFYFLKIWWEKVVIFFTFDLARKAEKYKTFAEKRAFEAEKMVEEGKIQLAEELHQRYENYLNEAREYLEKAIAKAVAQGEERLKEELDRKVDQIKSMIKEKLW